MLCAVCVQIEYHNMEIMDTVDVDYEDLKSPGGNTVWVRPPPALPDLRGSDLAGF